MKQIYNLLGIALLCIAMFQSCKKGGNTTPDKDNVDKPIISGNTITYPTGYVTKVIGVSRMLIGIDAREKLTVATLYGGGNKVVFTAGSSNTIELVGNGQYAVMPEDFAPDGSIGNGVDAPIDNSTIADTNSVSLKIKGFDKAKYGYNQLNLIVHKLVRATPPGTAGFFNNMAWITYNNSRKNEDYRGDFFKKLLSGPVNVTDVQMTKTIGSKPYVVEDQVVDVGMGAWGPEQSTSMRLNSNTYEVACFPQYSNNYALGGSTFKYEWINTNGGKVTKLDDFEYQIEFSNMKSANDVVIASDTTKYAFLRISGFNPSVTGFNQLRLFVGKSTNSKRYLRLVTRNRLPSTPTLTAALAMLTPENLVVSYAAPYVPHY